MIGLPWLETAGRQLRDQYRQQRLPHGLLIVGGSGLGADKLIQWLEGVLLCQHPDRAPCGQCHSCNLRLAGNHGDLLHLQPEGKGQQIKVGAVRELVSFSQGKAQYSQNQVVLVQQAERLNLAAANALLKVLEEPPAGTYLLLQSAEPARLLPTIRSRLQWFRCPAPPAAEGQSWLEGQGVEQAAAELALALADHQPCNALMLATEDFMSRRQRCLDLLRGQIERPSPNLEVLTGLLEPEPVQVLSIWRPWLADAARLAQGGADVPLRNTDQADALQSLLGRYPTAALWLRLYDAVEQLRIQVEADNNLNWQLLLEQFWLSIPREIRRTA